MLSLLVVTMPSKTKPTHSNTTQRTNHKATTYHQCLAGKSSKDTFPEVVRVSQILTGD
jgi:hypothetical protein